MGLLYDYHVMLTIGFIKVTSGYVYPIPHELFRQLFLLIGL